jgi:hypothetical protein
MDALVKKLKLLKSLVVKWERKKKLETKEELVKIEKDIDTCTLTIKGVLGRRLIRCWY